MNFFESLKAMYLKNNFKSLSLRIVREKSRIEKKNSEEKTYTYKYNIREKKVR